MKQKAFTLVELMVVIAIIGILSAVVLANLNTARAKSRDAKRISDISMIQLVLQTYFDRCNRYPTASAGIPDIASSAGCPGTVTLGTFITAIPTPPTGISNVTTYWYILKTDGSDFYLGTPLENSSTVLSDDIDGTVGGGGNWTGYNGGTFSAADGGANPVYAITSK